MRGFNRQFLADIKLKKKIFLLISFTVAVQIVFGIVLNAVMVRDAIKKTTVSYTGDIVANLQRRVSEKISYIENVSQGVIYNAEIYRILMENIKPDDALKNYEYQNVINGYLKELVFAGEGIQSIAIYNRAGYAYVWDADNDLRRLSDLPVQTLRDESDTAPDWVLHNEKLYLIREIRDVDTFNVIGTMFFYIKSDILGLSDESVADAQNIMLFSETGETIFESRKKTYIIDKDKFYDNMLGKSGYYLDNSNRCMVSFKTVPDVNWCIAEIVPFNTLYRDSTLVLYILLLFEGIVLCCTFFSNRIFSRDILQPINELNQYIEEFEKSGKVDDTPVNRKDELGYILNRFKEMTKQIQHLIESVYQEKIYRKNAQIKALQAQISPHFIYNALEAINWTAQFKGVPEISDMVVSLASLMQANAGKTDSVVSIEQELDYVKNYCDIFRFRYSDRIIFKYKISPDCANVKVPCLLIQPLVENSLKYGFKGKGNRGMVYIKVYKAADRIIIKVVDNGVGIDEDYVEDMNIKLANAQSVATEDTLQHIGIINVCKRIKLFYGEGYGVRIESVPNHYCAVICEISANSNGRE